MSPNPESFLRHLQEVGYHPRSDKHSNALAEAIVQDLVANCRVIVRKARSGELVYQLNFTLTADRSDWNVDLVIGPPELGETTSAGDALIRRSTPSSVQVAVELKSVMTEHRKAVKNRKRDLEAHHEHVHHYSPQAIAGGVFVINASPTFRSPLRSEVTRHRNISTLVEHCVSELRSIPSSRGLSGVGLEAKCAIVLETDNQTLRHTAFLTKSPAPGLGDPLRYDAFIRSLCSHYSQRFS